MVVNGLDEYISTKCQQCVKNNPICGVPGVSYVLDGCSFTKHIIQQTSWVFGGQWKEIKQATENFVKSLLSEGCELIFVMPHWPDALTPANLHNIRVGLDFVAANKRLPSIDFYHTPPGAYFFISQVVKECGVEVICSVSDFEFEVAAWAKVKKCTGIISNNNEFIALNGVGFYRLSSLDLLKHTIDSVERHVLMKNLGLKPHHLPVLSCIMGNSLVPPMLLQAFHKKLQAGMRTGKHNPVLDIMPRLCMYVRPQTTQHIMLARTALGDESQAAFLEAIVARYSLTDVSEAWQPSMNTAGGHNSQIYEDAYRKQTSCLTVPFVSQVLSAFSYEEGITLEHKPFTPSFDLYRPLRATCYSIIVGGNATVSEKCASSETAVQTVTCQNLMIKDKVMTIDKMWDCSNTLKWAVFVKCAHVTFNKTLARELPTQFVGLCCILNYWWHSPLIHLSQWELNAFLAQAVSQYAGDVTSLQRVLVTVVNSRAITLAAMLARGAEALQHIAATVGLPPHLFLPHQYFDGKLFSFYYYLADNGSDMAALCDNLPDRIEMFQFLLMVVQSEGLAIEGEEEEMEEEKEEEEEEETVDKSDFNNVSIVPEYEAISDDEEEGVEPVSDDDTSYGHLNTQPTSMHITQANTPYFTTNTPFAQANTSYSTTNTTLTQANTPFSTTNTPLTQVNTPFSNKNTTVTHANTTYSTTNTPFAEANTRHPTTNTSLTQANTPYSTTNTPFTQANTSYSTTNTPLTQANTSYSTTNTPFAEASTHHPTANTPLTQANTHVYATCGVNTSLNGAAATYRERLNSSVSAASEESITSPTLDPNLTCNLPILDNIVRLDMRESGSSGEERKIIPLPSLPEPLPLFPWLAEPPKREKRHSDKENRVLNKAPFYAGLSPKRRRSDES